MIVQFTYGEYKYLKVVQKELGTKSISQAYKKCLDKKTLFDMYIREFSDRPTNAYKAVFIAPLKDDVLFAIEKLCRKYLDISDTVCLKKLLSNKDMQDEYCKLMGWM